MIFFFFVCISMSKSAMVFLGEAKVHFISLQQTDTNENVPTAVGLSGRRRKYVYGMFTFTRLFPCSATIHLWHSLEI